MCTIIRQRLYLLKTALPSLLLVFCHASSSPGADFQNLGFESPTFVAVPSGYAGTIDPIQALPGWTLRAGTSAVPYVGYDGFFLDSTGASLFDDGRYSFFPPPVECTYELLLQGGVHPPWLPNGPPISFDRIPISLFQTALVPSSAKALTFWAWGPGLAVSMGGQELPQVLIASTPGLSLYGVDISSFAGTTTELRFTVNPPPLSSQYSDINNVLLDGVSFSTTPVPEPGGALLILAACSLALYGAGQRRKRY
jgi:hypothetical protein